MSFSPLRLLSDSLGKSLGGDRLSVVAFFAERAEHPFIFTDLRQYPINISAGRSAKTRGAIDRLTIFSIGCPNQHWYMCLRDAATNESFVLDYGQDGLHMTVAARGRPTCVDFSLTSNTFDTEPEPASPCTCKNPRFSGTRCGDYKGGDAVPCLTAQSPNIGAPPEAGTRTPRRPDQPIVGAALLAIVKPWGNGKYCLRTRNCQHFSFAVMTAWCDSVPPKLPLSAIPSSVLRKFQHALLTAATEKNSAWTDRLLLMCFPRHSLLHSLEDRSGNTVFHILAEKGDARMLAKAIEAGCPLNGWLLDECALLQQPVQRGDFFCLIFFAVLSPLSPLFRSLSDIPPFLRTVAGDAYWVLRTYLLFPSFGSRPRRMYDLCHLANVEGVTPLDKAIQGDHTDCIELLRYSDALRQRTVLIWQCAVFASFASLCTLAWLSGIGSMVFWWFSGSFLLLFFRMLLFEALTKAHKE